MEEYRYIKHGLGNVSMNKELGSYYIDMRPSMVHYKHNFYGGGFDINGVPMCKNADGARFYFPINIAQYGFMLHSEWIINQDKNIFTILLNCLSVLDNLKTMINDSCVWYNTHYDEKYNINPPWASAMAQGEMISFYLRMGQILKDNNLLIIAEKAFNFLKIDYVNGGVRRFDKDGHLWFEEYPTNKPSFVLNGFIFTLFGLFDLYRVTNDPVVKSDIDSCIETLKKNLKKFDAGYWSYYDLLKKELVRYYYQQNVHVLQMHILYLLTREHVFLHYKTKWESTLNPFNFLLVKVMYRIRPRYQWIAKLMGQEV